MTHDFRHTPLLPRAKPRLGYFLGMQAVIAFILVMAGIVIRIISDSTVVRAVFTAAFLVLFIVIFIKSLVEFVEKRAAIMDEENDPGGSV